MRKWIKILAKSIAFLLAIPVFYLLIAFILSSISVNKGYTKVATSETIFLASNGVHLDIVLPKSTLNPTLQKDLLMGSADQYLAFGWGDEKFYLETPTWGDMTLKNVSTALLLKSPSLIHVTRYRQLSPNWVSVPIDTQSLALLNQFIEETFQKGESQSKILLPNQGYTVYDDFYRANGNYSCFYTCNSWVNHAFKASNLKACYWTTFDFSLMNRYR